MTQDRISFAQAMAWVAGVHALMWFDDAGRRRVARNPFPARSARALAWREGVRAKAAQIVRLRAGRPPIVPCETRDETNPKDSTEGLARPGRGGCLSGPRREWLDWEKRLAWTCQTALSRRDIADLLPGRDAQAVKNQLHRMKLRQRSEVRGQMSERKASCPIEK